MAPRKSLWGFLTREGRRRNRWAIAAADPDRARGLETLRSICAALRGSPSATAENLIDLFEDFLTEDRSALLTPADFALLETILAEVGPKLPASGETEPSWRRLLALRDRRNEKREARALLARMCREPSLGDAVRQSCVRELAHREGQGDDHVELYLQQLARTGRPNDELEILELLSRMCRADFDTNPASLKRAAEIGARLIALKIEAPHARTTLGLKALEQDRDLKAAEAFLKSALAADANDGVAQVALAVVRLRQGNFDAPSMPAPPTSDPTIARLARLGVVLQWLDQIQTPGPPPAKAEELAALDPGRAAGDEFHVAVGRLHLLEGNAAKAAEILEGVAARRGDRPEWSYHAAWAHALCGDAARLAKTLERVSAWSGRWAIACLLRELGPQQLPDETFLALAKDLPEECRSVIRARVAMSRLERAGQVAWKPRSRSAAEDLEAMRTMLGMAFRMRNAEQIDRFLAHPAFLRLPLAEQNLWRGAQAFLFGDRAEGRTLLESAVSRGSRRAELILGVALLEQGIAPDGLDRVDRALAGRSDPKARLLRAYVSACRGHTVPAAAEFEAMRSSIPRAAYALRNLWLHQAATLRRMHRQDQCRVYLQQAAKLPEPAAKDGYSDQPCDAGAIAQCIRFLDDPAARAKPLAWISPPLESLPRERQRPWLVWCAMAARLCAGSDSGAAVACQRLGELVDDAADLDAETGLALACTAAAAAKRSKDPASVEPFQRLLGRLASRCDHAEIRRLNHLVMVHGALSGDLRSDRARQQLARLARLDPRNLSLCLAAVRGHLKASDREAARSLLEAAAPEGEFERRLTKCLLRLVNGSPPLPEECPTAPPGSSAARGAACDWIQAAGMLGGPPHPSAIAAVTRAVTHSKARPPILPVQRLLPIIAAGGSPGPGRSASTVDAVRALASLASTAPEAATAARCAAAVGEVELAGRLWQQALAGEGADASWREEYQQLLCHLSVRSSQEKRFAEAAAHLRAAASLSNGKPHHAHS